MKERDVFRRLGRGIWGKPMRRPLIASILILVLVAQSGCAGTGSDQMPAPALLPPPPGDAVLIVAVTSGRFVPSEFVPSEEVERPDDWNPARAFADHPLLFTIDIIVGAPIIAVALLALPVFLPLVVLDRFLTGPSPEVREANKRLSAVRELMKAHAIQDEVRDRVVTMGRARTSHTLTVLTDRGPSAADEQPDYRSLSQEGIQYVLEVVVTVAGIYDDGRGSNSKPPLFRLVMHGRTRLIRAVDNAEVYAKPLNYHSGWGTLTEWVDGPEGFRDELNRAYADIAEQIVDDVFLHTGSN